MAKVSILSLIILAMMTMLGHGNMDPDFWWSDVCTNPSIHWSSLTATCKSICSTLDLNHCFGFDFNQGIYAKDDGNFFNWCDNCVLGSDKYTMTCTCLKKEGGSKSWSVDTDYTITTQEGLLKCFNHVGTKCSGKEAKLDTLDTTISAQVEASAAAISQSLTA